MTGNIIHFQSRRDLRQGQLCRQQALPELRAERIAELLKELEELTGNVRRPRVHLTEDDAGDPQPEIDCDKLDRMYRDLGF